MRKILLATIIFLSPIVVSASTISKPLLPYWADPYYTLTDFSDVCAISADTVYPYFNVVRVFRLSDNTEVFPLGQPYICGSWGVGGSGGGPLFDMSGFENGNYRIDLYQFDGSDWNILYPDSITFTYPPSAEPPPPAPDAGIVSMITFANDKYSATTGFTPAQIAQFASTGLASMLLGASLAVLLALSYWIVALLIIVGGVYFSYRALRYAKNSYKI